MHVAPSGPSNSVKPSARRRSRRLSRSPLQGHEEFWNLRGHPTAALSLLTIITVILAGCLGSGRVPDTSPSTSGGPTNPPVGCSLDPQGCIQSPNGAFSYSIEMSDCTRVQQTLNFRREVFAPVYPSSVTPAQTVFGLPAEVASLELWDCRQVVQGQEIMKDFQFAALSGLIQDPNASEKDIVDHLFLLQVYTNSRSLVENASSAYGLQITYADRVSVSYSSFTPSAPGSGPSANYEFSLPAGAGPDYHVTGQIRMSPVATTNGTNAFFFENSTKQLNHWRLSETGNLSGSLEGNVEFGPQSYWSQHSSVDRWNFVNVRGTGISARLQFRSGI
jgi:hypothetical protein